MNQYVLDTSVMLRWFSLDADPDAARALQLRQAHLDEELQLVVLDQSVYELIHILKESDRFGREPIEQALASLHFLHISIEPFDPEIAARTVQIAFEHDLNIWAAGPIALGAHLRCQTVTGDEAVYRKVAGLPWTALLSRLHL